MKSKLTLYFFAVLLLGCNNPLDRTFNEENADKDIQAIIDSKKLDSLELKLMAGYLIKGKLLGENLEEMTYAEMLENAKKQKTAQEEEQAKQRALAEKAEREEAERHQKLRDVLTVSIYEKDFMKHRYREYITYKFAFENKASQEIRGFKGRVAFNDLFDDEISSLSLKYDQPIEAGKTVTWSAQTEFNEFIDRDVSLKSKDLKDINMVWEPEKIIFADGSVLE